MRLIEAHSRPFDVARYVDPYQDAFRGALDAKVRKAPEPVAELHFEKCNAQATDGCDNLVNLHAARMKRAKGEG